jgi:predicted alpha/beta-hydrolase family hydrolase
LHPPGRPDTLRTGHFGDITVPCLFVSGRRDAFASPEELEAETAAVAGPVTLAFVDGDHALRTSSAEAGEIVASWLASLN